MAVAAGGKRKGAGRPPGAKDTKERKTKRKRRDVSLRKEVYERFADIIDTANIKKLPAQIMLDNMVWAQQEAERLLRKCSESALDKNEEMAFRFYDESLKLRGFSQKCAVDAAPYIHPKKTPLPPAPEDPESPSDNGEEDQKPYLDLQERFQVQARHDLKDVTPEKD